jgi:hypothetical protein
MSKSQYVEWPKELAFMLRGLQSVQLVSLISTQMDAGNVRTRQRYSPKEGWVGEATFTDDEKQLMESLIGKQALAQLPHRNELSLVALLHDRAIYPGYGPKVIQQTWNSDEGNAWNIRYHFWDTGPYSGSGANPHGSETV